MIISDPPPHPGPHPRPDPHPTPTPTPTPDFTALIAKLDQTNQLLAQLNATLSSIIGSQPTKAWR